MEFKQLDIKPEGSWLKRKYQSQHVRRSILFIVIGAIGSFTYFYFTEGRYMDEMWFDDIVNSVLIGGFLGFIISNSPCARNKC